MIAVAVLFVLTGVPLLIQSLASGDLDDIGAGAATVLFFGGCAFIGMRRLTRPSGAIEIQRQGLVLSCYSMGPFSGVLGGYASWGFADWRNLTAVATVKVTGFSCVGLAFKDPTAFITAREKLREGEFNKAAILGQQSGRVLKAGCAVLPIGKFLGLYMTLLGFSGIPKSADEKDVLEWNHENYGYHLLIPAALIPSGSDSLLRLINERRVEAVDAEKSDEDARGEAHTFAAMARTIEARLLELEELYGKRLITEEEYKAKRKEILSGL